MERGLNARNVFLMSMPTHEVSLQVRKWNKGQTEPGEIWTCDLFSLRLVYKA